MKEDDREHVEEYTVSVVRDSKLRLKFEQWRNPSNELHRDDGPAFTVFDPRTGNPIQTRRYQNDFMTASTQPALIHLNPETGAVQYEIWYSNNQRHRSGGEPAYFKYDESGEKLVETRHYREGVLHRENGPARCEFDAKSGVCVREEYWLDGVRSSVEGSAVLIMDPNSGKVLQRQSVQEANIEGGEHFAYDYIPLFDAE